MRVPTQRSLPLQVGVMTASLGLARHLLGRFASEAEAHLAHPLAQHPQPSAERTANAHCAAQGTLSVLLLFGRRRGAPTRARRARQTNRDLLAGSRACAAEWWTGQRGPRSADCYRARQSRDDAEV